MDRIPRHIIPLAQTVKNASIKASKEVEKQIRGILEKDSSVKEKLADLIILVIAQNSELQDILRRVGISKYGVKSTK